MDYLAVISLVVISLVVIRLFRAPLHGRFDWIERYNPLDYYDAGRFLDATAPVGHGYSHRDKLIAYGIYGGSGRYLAQINPGRPLHENVAAHLLDPAGIFQREGETLIRQERDIREDADYNAILAAVAAGATDGAEIANQSHVDSKSLSNYLTRLKHLGWLRQQHLARFAGRYGLPMISAMGRWWGRRQDVEIDLVVELHDGSYLFGEVKWASSPVRLSELFELERKVAAVPHPAWKKNPRYALFSAGRFEEKLVLAAKEQGVLLVGAEELYA